VASAVEQVDNPAASKEEKNIIDPQAPHGTLVVIFDQASLSVSRFAWE